MVKNAGEPCALSVSCGLQVPIGDSLTTSSLTHTGANVSRLLKRLFEGSRAYRLEFLHIVLIVELASLTLELFSKLQFLGRIRVHFALFEVVMKIDCCK